MMGWLFIFFVHSTLWLGLAWLWIRMRPKTPARVRETLWYAAIVASIITPTVQSFMFPQAALWRVSLPAILISSSEHAHGARASTRSIRAEHSEGGGAVHEESGFSSSATGHSTWAVSESGVNWMGITIGIGLAISGVLMLCYFGRLVAFRWRIGRREIVNNPGIQRMLGQLSHQAGLSNPPRLTESENLGSPIALGCSNRAEICVPTRALSELDRNQFRALLGHEVAHHLRCDPLCLLGLNALLTAFFFQPLFRLAAREIQSAAEEQCDEWAAKHLEDRLDMASCLTEVATWLLPRDRAVPVPCMARYQSQLRARVDRLMDEESNSESPPGVRREIAISGFLAMALWLAPGMAPADEPLHESSVSIPRSEMKERKIQTTTLLPRKEHEHEHHDER